MRARKRACYDFFLSQLLDDLTCDKGDRAIKRFPMNGFALTGNSYLQHVNSNFFGPLYNPLKWIVKSRSDIIYGGRGNTDLLPRFYSFRSLPSPLIQLD